MFILYYIFIYSYGVRMWLWSFTSNVPHSSVGAADGSSSHFDRRRLRRKVRIDYFVRKWIPIGL